MHQLTATDRLRRRHQLTFRQPRHKRVLGRGQDHVCPPLLLGDLAKTPQEEQSHHVCARLPSTRSSHTHQNEEVQQGLHFGPVLPTPLHQLVHLVAKVPTSQQNKMP